MNPNNAPTSGADYVSNILASQPSSVSPISQQGSGDMAAAHQPSWWQKLLPAAGGVLGGIGGTLLGGPLGGIAGATLGGSLGQAGENATEGKAVLQGNDVSSGLENGVGQAIGLGVGKVVGAAGGALTKFGEGQAAKAAETATAQGVGDDAAAKNLIYNEAMKARGAPVLRNSGGFQSTLDNAQALGINPTAPNAPQLMSEAGHAQTGGSLDGKGFLNDTVDSLIAKHGDSVSMAGEQDATGNVTNSLQSELEGAINRQNQTGANLGELTDTTVGAGKRLAPANNPAQQLIKTISSMSPKLQTSTMGSGIVSPTMTTQEADTFAKNLGNYAFTPSAKDTAGNVINPVEDAQRGVAKDLFNYVRGQVDNQPGIANAVKAMQASPELAASIDPYVSKISDPNVAAAVKQKIMTDVSNAQTLPDLRAAQSDAVDMSKLGDHVDTHNAENTFTAGAVKRAQPEDLTGATPSAGQGVANVIGGTLAATGHPVGLAASALTKLNDAGMTPKIASGLGGVLSRIAPLSAPVDTALSNGPNIAAATVPQGGGSTMNPMNPNGQPQQVNPMNQLYATLLAQEQAAPTVLGPQLAGTLAGLAPQIQHNQMAANTVANLAPSFANAGGAQGFGGGLLSKFTAMVPGTAANAYQGQQQAAAAQLASVLGISPEAAAHMLPQLMQNSGVAGQQQTGVSGLLGSLNGGAASQ